MQRLVTSPVTLYWYHILHTPEIYVLMFLLDNADSNTTTKVPLYLPNAGECDSNLRLTVACLNSESAANAKARVSGER